MLIIPAIDLKDGRCVRLKQGDMSTATVFSDDPVAMAKHWAAQGAKRLHIVDLNGAVAGRPKNEKVIRDIVAAVGGQLQVQLGGGIRDLDTIESYIDAGVTLVVIGTAVYGKPFTCAIARDNIFAVQFHPEKSQSAGLQLLSNFVNWRP